MKPKTMLLALVKAWSKKKKLEDTQFSSYCTRKQREKKKREPKENAGTTGKKASKGWTHTRTAAARRTLPEFAHWRGRKARERAGGGRN